MSFPSFLFIDLNPNQTFVWPLARPATDDEYLIIELGFQSTKRLIQSGISNVSKGILGSSNASESSYVSTSGSILGSNRCFGRYLLLMQGKPINVNFISKKTFYTTLLVFLWLGLCRTGCVTVEDFMLDPATSRALEVITYNYFLYLFFTICELIS